MSGRFQTHTVASEGAELDDNYQKMVADIEEQTQRSGWLFGRGAFDKGDLQYLRDFNSSLRYKEVEIEDKEKELWERERARVEAEAAAAAAQQAAALTRRSSGICASVGLRGPPGVSTRPAPLLLPVKVKPAGSKQQQTPRSAAASPSTAGEGPSSKRARTDSSNGAAALTSPLSTTAALSAAAAATISAAAPTPSGTLRSAKSEPPTVKPSANHSRISGPLGDAAAAAMGAGVAVQPATSAAAAVQVAGSDVSDQGRSPSARAWSAPDVSGSGGTAAGLATLLGGYGSEDDDDDGGDDGSKKNGEKNGEEDGGRGGCIRGSSRSHRPGRGSGDGDDGRNSACNPQAGCSEGPAEGDGGRRGWTGGAEASPGDNVEEGVMAATATVAAAAAGGSKLLPPPVGLLSPEELLGDPRVIAEGLLATRPQPQNVQGGDTWDSEEASDSSDAEA